MFTKSQSDDRPVVLEALEPRLLLSVQPVEGFEPLRELPGGAMLEATKFNSASTPALRTTDFGDYYWADGKQIPLLRRLDQVVIKFGSREDRLAAAASLAALVAANEGLTTFNLGPEYSVVDAKLLGEDELADAVNLDVLRGLPGADWVSLAFVGATSGAPIYPTDEVIVALGPGADAAAFFGEAFSGYRRLGGTTDQWVATVSEGDALGALAMADVLASNPQVMWAAPNLYHTVYLETTPNDTLYSAQWHLNNTGQNGTASGADVNAPEAWEATVGNSDIVVAILDNGVQLDHPDLNIWTNAGEIAANDIDDDGNGWVDDVHGYNFVDYDENPGPGTVYDNHGTAVAGVAAAAGNNSIGVTGASQGAKIMAIRVAESTVDAYGNPVDSFASSQHLAEAVYYAGGKTREGMGSWDAADILNLSWRLGSEDTTLSSALMWAHNNGRHGKGNAIFAAAGNFATGYGYYGLSSSWLSANLNGWNGDSVAVEWIYAKDLAGTAGSDKVWLADVSLPEGSSTRYRFENGQVPPDWNANSRGTAWSVSSDAAHAYGVSPYLMASGNIGNSSATGLLTDSFTLDIDDDLTFRAWVSSEKGTSSQISFYPDDDDGDWLFLVLYNYTEQVYTWFAVDAGVPGGLNTRRSVNMPFSTAVSYPANLSSTIAVGASTDWNCRSDYSQYGSALDFVAPSGGGYAGITTTDRTGTAGYNTATTANGGDYTSAFGGTSSASPLAAGIAALLLSKNPNLTAEQIRGIMQDSAEKIGPVAYSGGRNDYYGYGCVDAEAALDIMAGPVEFEDIIGTTQSPRTKGVGELHITFPDDTLNGYPTNFTIGDLKLDRQAPGGSWESVTLTEPMLSRPDPTNEPLEWVLNLKTITNHIGASSPGVYTYQLLLKATVGVTDQAGNEVTATTEMWTSSIRRGDMNGDGALNVLDITGFVSAITGGFSDPDIAAMVGDMNVDDSVNTLDIAGFVSAITGGTGAPAALDLQTASDTGASSTDDITPITAPTFNIDVQASYFRVYRSYNGGTPELISGEQETGTTWTTASAQLDNEYQYYVAGVYSDGSATPLSNPLTVTIDTQAPQAPDALDLQAGSDSGISSTDNITNDTTPTFDVDVAAPYFRVYRDNVLVSDEFASGATWADTLSQDGTYSYQLAAVDTAGNESALSSALNITIDTMAPTVTIAAVSGDSQNPRYTGINQIGITFSEAVYGFSIADLELKRNSNSVSLANATLTDNGNHINWTLGDLKTETSYIGGTGVTLGEHDYELLLPQGASYTDLAGNSGSLDSETWHAHVRRGDLTGDGNYDTYDFYPGAWDALYYRSTYDSQHPNIDADIVGDMDYDGDYDEDDFLIISEVNG